MFVRNFLRLARGLAGRRIFSTTAGNSTNITALENAFADAVASNELHSLAGASLVKRLCSVYLERRVDSSGPDSLAKAEFALWALWDAQSAAMENPANPSSSPLQSLSELVEISAFRVNIPVVAGRPPTAALQLSCQALTKISLEFQRFASSPAQKALPEGETLLFLVNFALACGLIVSKLSRTAGDLKLRDQLGNSIQAIKQRITKPAGFKALDRALTAFCLAQLEFRVVERRLSLEETREILSGRRKIVGAATQRALHKIRVSVNNALAALAFAETPNSPQGEAFLRESIEQIKGQISSSNESADIGDFLHSNQLLIENLIAREDWPAVEKIIKAAVAALPVDRCSVEQAETLEVWADRLPENSRARLDLLTTSLAIACLHLSGLDIARRLVRLASAHSEFAETENDHWGFSIDYYAQALEEFEQNILENSKSPLSDLSNVIDELGMIYASIGHLLSDFHRYSENERHFRRSAEFLEKILIKGGKISPNALLNGASENAARPILVYCLCLRDRGVALREEEKFGESEKLLRKSVQLQRELKGALLLRAVGKEENSLTNTPLKGYPERVFLSTLRELAECLRLQNRKETLQEALRIFLQLQRNLEESGQFRNIQQFIQQNPPNGESDIISSSSSSLSSSSATVLYSSPQEILSHRCQSIRDLINIYFNLGEEQLGNIHRLIENHIEELNRFVKQYQWIEKEKEKIMASSSSSSASSSATLASSMASAASFSPLSPSSSPSLSGDFLLEIHSELIDFQEMQENFLKKSWKQLKKMYDEEEEEGGGGIHQEIHGKSEEKKIHFQHIPQEGDKMASNDAEPVESSASPAVEAASVENSSEESSTGATEGPSEGKKKVEEKAEKFFSPKNNRKDDEDDEGIRGKS